MATSFYDNQPNFSPVGNIISYVNQKGGVGKTTSCINISSIQSLNGFTVMLDLDAQNSLTTSCNMEPDVYDGMDICKLFEKDVDPFDCCYSVDSVKNKTDKLYIIPGTQRLALVIEKLYTNSDTLFIFKENVQKLSKVFLNVAIDCSPSLDRIMQAALIASTKAVIPVKPDSMSAKSLELIIPTIETVKTKPGPAQNKDLEIAGIILNLCRKIDEHIRISEEIKKSYNVLGSVNESSMVTKEASRGLPVVIAHPSSAPAKAFKEIASKI